MRRDVRLCQATPSEWDKGSEKDASERFRGGHLPFEDISAALGAIQLTREHEDYI